MASSPFVVDITDLKRRPKARRHFERVIDDLDDFRLVTAEVDADTLTLDLWLEMMGADLVVEGTIGIEWSGPCRRCLERRSGSTTAEIREIFQTRPVEGETYELGDERVDLETMLREAVLLHLPVAPLCGIDCAGPDPERFPASVEIDAAEGSSDDEVEAPVDPRWSALSELVFDEPDE